MLRLEAKIHAGIGFGFSHLDIIVGARASHHCHRESRPQQHGLTSIGCRSLAPLEQNKNYVNSWLHGALNGARSVIANFEGARRARRRATMGAVKFRSRLDRKKPATDFPARAWILQCCQYAGDLPDVSIFPKRADRLVRWTIQDPEPAAAWRRLEARKVWQAAAKRRCQWPVAPGLRSLWMFAELAHA